MTTIAADGRSAGVMAHDEDFDLMILDLGLPDKDGLDVLRDLRASGQQLPVIVLDRARRHPRARRRAGHGRRRLPAKPFHFEELVARIKVQLRDAKTGPQEEQLRVGDVVLDLRTRWATVDGEPVELSAREFELLRTFLQHPDQVLSREQLLARVWGYAYDPGSNVVDVYVGYLRRKLGSEHFETVRGVGYRFRGLRADGRTSRHVSAGSGRLRTFVVPIEQHVAQVEGADALGPLVGAVEEPRIHAVEAGPSPSPWLDPELALGQRLARHLDPAVAAVGLRRARTCRCRSRRERPCADSPCSAHR